MGNISVTGVGKAYKAYNTRFARLKEWVLPFSQPRHQIKWVLQDINFNIRPGEAVGIIGVNGAGKSTLLKILAGTTQPTTGSVHTSGRVAALLELGIGFHPEFTGRQNAIMACQLLGMGMDEIMALMPTIEAFAEIGEYIDYPVRVYSSGMQMRLAFSVATARRPDILIVDEALSVGDAYFQHKSFECIRDFRKQGTTLLIVSHDKIAIQSICDRAILLNAGRVAMEGKPEAVMDYYNAMLSERKDQSVRQMVAGNGKVQTVSGTGEAVLVDIALLDEKDDRVETIEVGEMVTLHVKARVNKDIPRLVMGYMIKDRFGQPVYGTNTHHLGHAMENLSSGSNIEFRVKFSANLGTGTYSIAVALQGDATHLENNYEWRDLALIFTVVNTNMNEFIGVTWLPPKLECHVHRD